MDMYQKRKMRQEKKKNSNQNGSDKIQVNWDNPTYVKPLANLYK